MPATKNAMTRYKFLDELLSNKYHRLSMEELTEEVNKRLAYIDGKPVGVRCIQKDIKYLKSDPFYAPIVSTKEDSYDAEQDKATSKLCWYYDDPTFSIFSKKMSDDEKYLLGETMNLIGQFDGLPNFEALESLRSSLKLNDSSRRQIVNFGKNPAGDSNLFGLLFTAISQKQVIELHYHTGKEPDSKKICNVHPYQLKEYNCSWYLLCAAETDGKLLNFPLFNIDAAIPLLAHEYVEPTEELDEWFDDIVGVSLYLENPVEHMFFWVSDESIKYIDKKPIHGSQTPCRGEKETRLREQFPKLEGGKFYSIRCRNSYELVRELCSYGENLVVLSSDAGDKSKCLSAIKSRVENMHKVYVSYDSSFLTK